MKRTDVFCDHCGEAIANGGWTITVRENHGSHRGTMGEEHYAEIDLCPRCGNSIADQVQVLVKDAQISF